MKIEVTFGYPNGLRVMTTVEAAAITIKSLGLIAWPWWVVLAPAWCTLAFVAGYIAAMLVVRHVEGKAGR